jgi:hypothetical protein
MASYLSSYCYNPQKWKKPLQISGNSSPIKLVSCKVNQERNYISYRP